MKTCVRLNIPCINVSNSSHTLMTDPSRRHAETLNQMLEYQKKCGGKYLYVDSDMFLIDNDSGEDYERYDVMYVSQARGYTEYLGLGYFIRYTLLLAKP